ncbi:MAG TPA: efflux RND transporter periplasmic adaptor subunit [Burkholderiales bacterium]|nr:efflux RND transporter periplasmic adaptor subunit [Burkholderiales bacterium]
MIGRRNRLYAQRSNPVRMAGRVSGTGLIAGLVLVLAGLFAIGLWPKWHALKTAQAEAGKDDLPAVLYVPAKRGSAKADMTLPATLYAMQETTIYARTNGYLKRWLVDIGDSVKAGQVLAEIEAPELDRELDQAHASRAQVKANLDLARVTAERYAALLKEEAVSPQEVDEKQGLYAARNADYAAAEANLRRLEQMKSFQRVVAPFSGTITARNVEVGSLIQAGSASASGWLFKLAQTDTIRVHAAVPQSSMRLVKPGMTVDLVVPELGDQAFAAKVMRNAGAFDAATRTMIVEMHVPNRGGPLLPGMYAQARLKLVNPEPSIQIPINALMVGGEGARVATVDPNGVVQIKPVKVGRDLGKEVEIVAGLDENERVINNPRDSLANGTKVRATEMQAHNDKKDAPKPAGTPAATDKPKS